MRSTQVPATHTWMAPWLLQCLFSLSPAPAPLSSAAHVPLGGWLAYRATFEAAGAKGDAPSVCACMQATAEELYLQSARARLQPRRHMCRTAYCVLRTGTSACVASCSS